MFSPLVPFHRQWAYFCLRNSFNHPRITFLNSRSGWQGVTGKRHIELKSNVLKQNVAYTKRGWRFQSFVMSVNLDAEKHPIVLLQSILNYLKSNTNQGNSQFLTCSQGVCFSFFPSIHPFIPPSLHPFINTHSSAVDSLISAIVPSKTLLHYTLQFSTELKKVPYL